MNVTQMCGRAKDNKVIDLGNQNQYSVASTQYPAAAP